MRSVPARGKPAPRAAARAAAGMAAAWLLAWAGMAQAEVLEARVARVHSGAGSLEAVQLRVDWPRGAAEGRLRIQARQLDFPAIAYRGRAIDWSCPLRRLPAGGWACAGPVRSAGAATRALALQFSDEGLRAQLGDARGPRLTWRSDPARPGTSHVELKAVPVAWLGAFLHGLWEQGRWTRGALDGSVRVDVPERGGPSVTTDLQLRDVALETPDGLVAADALAGRLQLKWGRTGARERVEALFGVRAGELLVQRLYARFPGTPVALRVVAERDGDGPWRLPVLAADDPGVLRARGQAVLAQDASLRDLSLELSAPDLATVGARYGSGFLAPEGFGDLVLGGRLDATVALAAGQAAALSARFGGVKAEDPKGRFAFAGIDGTLDWRAGSDAQASALAWDRAALFGIDLGAARFALESSAGAVRLQAPARIPALGGTLVLEQLRWQAPRGEAGAEVGFGLAMESMDLGALSKRLGWPAFTGTVSGRLPGARLRNDVLTTEGEVEMRLFGGRVALRDLGMERPFGTAPTLAANVLIDDLDLEAMTRTLGFGSITGRLDGRIDDLRLVDWSPVAFDARLETDRAWKGKRRISQRAVADISDVGGSGLVGGLQGKALKLFDDFAYERIGWGCVLRENVCTMDGIGSAGDGYIIVAGAGLPRIQVVGFRRRVDWPTLVARLEAATEGQAPVIE